MSISSCLRLGLNNIIKKNVTIYENVIIGNNNKIYENTVIYPNTIIGDNNIILNNNIIGEYPIVSSLNYSNFIEKQYNGVVIGNNNFFHVRNIIFSGYDKRTIIGNNNKLLAENHIGHDTQINDNVVLYPRCITGGYSILLNNSVMGFNSTIQQRMVLGSYSMIGAGNNISHNIFPYYIIINGKYIRLNIKAIPETLLITNFDDELKYIISKLKNEKKISYDINNRISLLPENIKINIKDFIKNINIDDVKI